LAVLAFIAYAPALRGGFVFDDDSLLTNNALIKAPDGLYRFWFTSDPVDYWPMTMTSFWVEWRIWGLDPTGYHVTNLLLHIGSALILWAILKRLRVPGAYWAALLFAVHPVNVQSVAWISQRKNTLSMLLFLASIYCFLRTKWAEEVGSRGPRDRVWRSDPAYWLSLLAFILAMLSKGSVAILPLVLLGLLAWRRRLELADFFRAAPFFAIAGVLTLVNVQWQTHGVSGPIRTAGALERLLEAGATIWFYLYKALLPVHLVFFYPLWHIQTDDLRWWLPLLAAIGLTLFLWRKTHRRPPLPVIPSAARNPAATANEIPRCARNDIWRSSLFAWGYFCVALLPVMGFADIYFMKYSLVADHYEYLAIIGVLAWAAAAGWGAGGAKFGQVKLISSAALVALLTVMTWRQAHLFHDPETLYRVTLQENPQSWPAENNLGILDINASRPVPAFAHFAQALQLNPDFAEAHYNLGRLLKLMPNGAVRAFPHFARAVQLSPLYADAHFWLAVCLDDLSRPNEALTQYDQAIRLHTGNLGDAETNLAVDLAKAGRLAEALPHFEEAVRLKPAVGMNQFMLAEALGQLGRTGEAEAHYEAAVRLDPRLARPPGGP
jgi:tetratricopeptide (TPR) repeat protein